jgi:hypothetical protein
MESKEAFLNRIHSGLRTNTDTILVTLGSGRLKNYINTSNQMKTNEENKISLKRLSNVVGYVSIQRDEIDDACMDLRKRLYVLHNLFNGNILLMLLIIYCYYYY